MIYEKIFANFFHILRVEGQNIDFKIELIFLIESLCYNVNIGGKENV